VNETEGRGYSGEHETKATNPSSPQKHWMESGVRKREVWKDEEIVNNRLPSSSFQSSPSALTSFTGSYPYYRFLSASPPVS